MSVPLVVNGVTFNYPVQGDTNWGPVLTNWSIAVTNALKTSSNNFTLLTNHSIIFSDSEVVPKTLTLTIPSPLTATWVLTLPGDDGTAGQVLSTDGLGTTSWINAAGGGTINSGTTGQLAYYAANGTTLSGETMSGDATIAAGGVLTIANLAITNAKVATAAAIALTKLAATTANAFITSSAGGVLTPILVTALRAVATDANGLPVASTTTAAELAFVSGTTNPIQPQLNAKLNLSGGTMSGVLDMGGNKITTLSQGTVSGDAIAFPVSGSTANSGGSAGQINQGTISTPDFRTNAVTLSSGIAARSGAAGNSITTRTITTIGGKVLIVASATISGASLTILGKAAGFTIMQLSRDGSQIATSNCGLGMNNTANTFVYQHPLSLSCLDSPTSGSHTYEILYDTTSSGAIVDYNLNVVELRA